jgi:hypothetical protein
MTCGVDDGAAAFGGEQETLFELFDCPTLTCRFRYGIGSDPINVLSRGRRTLSSPKWVGEHR